MFVQPDMPGMRPRLPGQLSPHTQGPQPFGANPGSMGVPGGSLPPPKPPTPGENLSLLQQFDDLENISSNMGLIHLIYLVDVIYRKTEILEHKNATTLQSSGVPLYSWLTLTALYLENSDHKKFSLHSRVEFVFGVKVRFYCITIFTAFLWIYISLCSCAYVYKDSIAFVKRINSGFQWTQLQMLKPSITDTNTGS